MRGLRYGEISVRDSNLRVAALIVKQRGSAVEGGLDRTTFAISSKTLLILGENFWSEKKERFEKFFELSGVCDSHFYIKMPALPFI
jgi:hypothetical protein